MLRRHAVLAFRHLTPYDKHSILKFRPPISSTPLPSRRTSLPLQLRPYQHLASAHNSTQAPSVTTRKQETNTQKAPSANSRPATAGPQDLGGDTVHKTQAEQRKADWRIVKNLLRHLWPRDDWSVKARLIVALSLLVGGKVSRYNGRTYRTLTLYEPRL
jgi:ATP-binding cassette subfamily B (MDR/TAP) protein 7